MSICLSVEAAPGKPLAMPLGVVCLQHPPLRTLLAKKSGKEKKKKKVTKEEKPPWSCSRLGRKDPPLPPNPQPSQGAVLITPHANPILYLALHPGTSSW